MENALFGAAQVLRVSEIFSSIQGEGASAGCPSVFLRLALCNLRCGWCDTKYTWDFQAYRYEAEVRELEVGAVAEQVTALLGSPEGEPGSAPPRHLIITGGEPLLQQRGLAALFGRLPATFPVEIETNGTLAPSSALRARVAQWNVSPKLSNSGDALELRVRLKSLAAFRNTGRAWLKLVVAGDEDMAEADELVQNLEWPAERTMLMPQASDRGTLAVRAPWVAEAARSRGWKVSPRLHIERFDGRRGM